MSFRKSRPIPSTNESEKFLSVLAMFDAVENDAVDFFKFILRELKRLRGCFAENESEVRKDVHLQSGSYLKTISHFEKGVALARGCATRLKSQVSKALT